MDFLINSTNPHNLIIRSKSKVISLFIYYQILIQEKFENELSFDSIVQCSNAHKALKNNLNKIIQNEISIAENLLKYSSENKFKSN